VRSSCSIEQMQEEAENALAAAEGFEVEPRAKSSWRSSRTQQSAAAAGKRLLLARGSSLGLRYGTLARMRREHVCRQTGLLPIHGRGGMAGGVRTVVRRTEGTVGS
jgi:hypothetical protein